MSRRHAPPWVSPPYRAGPRSKSTQSPSLIRELRDLGNQARPQAAGADPDVPAGAIDVRVHALEVRTLNGLGLDVRMADVIRNSSLLETDGTLRWHGNLRSRVINTPRCGSQANLC